MCEKIGPKAEKVPQARAQTCAEGGRLVSLLDELYSKVWIVRPETLAMMIAVVERTEVTPQLVAAAMHWDPAKQEAAVYAHELQIPITVCHLPPGSSTSPQEYGFPSSPPRAANSHSASVGKRLPAQWAYATTSFQQTWTTG